MDGRSREDNLSRLVLGMEYLYTYEHKPHPENDMGWHHDLCAMQLSLLCQYREVAPVDFRSTEVVSVIESEIQSFTGYIERAKSEATRQRFAKQLVTWQEAKVWLPAMGDNLIQAFRSWGQPPYGERWTSSDS